MKKNDKDIIYGPVAVQVLVQIGCYDSSLGDAAKRILSIMAGYCGTKNYMYRSLSGIAKDCGVSSAAIQNQVRILKNHGYITIEPRYRPNGGRTSSIIRFNVAMAKQFYKCPAIFSKPNMAKLLWDLVTISSYGGIELEEVIGPLMPGSDINKVKGINNKNNKKKEAPSCFKPSQASRDANSWEIRAEHNKAANISNQDRKDAEASYEGLREYLTINQLTNLSLAIRREVKGMSLEDRTQHEMKRYHDLLREYQSKLLDNSVVEKVS